MEQQTRVKKYAQLREMIAEDYEETNFHDALAPFAKRLSAVDDRFNVDAKRATYSSYVPEHAKVKAYEQMFEENSEDLITNDFLEQFIEEVKNYNVQQGTSVSQETTENVLASYQRNEKQQQQSHKVMRDLHDEVEAIQEQAQVDFDEYEAELDEDELIDDVLEQIEKDVAFSHQTNNTDESEWLHQTQELTKAVESMGNSITSVNEKILATNRLVNFLLAVFILGLVIISGYVIYMILRLQGLL